jgi:hypothetical protein
VPQVWCDLISSVPISTAELEAIEMYLGHQIDALFD